MNRRRCAGRLRSRGWMTTKEFAFPPGRSARAEGAPGAPDYLKRFRSMYFSTFTGVSETYNWYQSLLPRAA